MKKLFFITCFTILFVGKIFGQAQIDIPLIVTDGTININLAFGLDLTATNCIDPHLGESDLPPIPPTGMFDVRFDLNPYGCPYISTMKDYRAPGNPPAFPFTGMIQHTLWWQISSPGLPINITYNLPPGTIMRIIDNITGTLLNLGPFAGQGVATIPGSYTTFGTKALLKIEYNNIGGDPNGPIFGISTYAINFPQMIVGNDTTFNVTVTNFGITNTLTISDIVSSNNYFTIAPNSTPINIAPLASQVFQVTNFSAATAQQGAIQFTHNAYGSPTNLNVSAPAGLQPGPVFGISSTSLIFPQRTVGNVDSILILISNYGYLNSLYINNISSSNSYFNMYPNSVPIEIEPQSFKAFYVTYTSADTIQQGTIELTHNAPGSPQSINVTSVYASPQFNIHPASLYFYSPQLTRRVWVTNTDNFDDLMINNITTSNYNYTVTPNNFPITIPHNTTVAFYISLNNASGFQFGMMKFYHTASGSPYSLPVSNQILQPLVEGEIVVSSGSENRTLRMGFDTLATDEIDEHLGEHGALPPFPPSGAFEAQYFLPENNYSGTLSAYSDFRFTDNTIATQKEWRIVYQPSPSGDIVINWDLPFIMTGVLQDIINGSFINVPISGSGNFVVPNPYTFNKLRMIINLDIETPVELISFNATLLDNKVKLDWVTATETNNSGFEIQRTSPIPSPYKGEGGEAGRGWEVIGFVPGFGTTTEPKSYSFTDENVTIRLAGPSAGTYKYRLKQIDFDGSFEYSNEIEVAVDITPKEFVLYQNYPNPFNPSTVISYQLPVNGNVTLKVYDVLGNEIVALVNEEKSAGEYEVEFDASSIASGMYLYKLQAGTFIQIKKMILAK